MKAGSARPLQLTPPRSITKFDEMSARPFSCAQLGAALAAGLALRLFFIWHFPFYSGDTKFYEELARNWLEHGVYGLYVRGALTAVDMRVPGYPAFLAAIYFVVGRSARVVMVAQALVDLGTCVMVALIATRLAPISRRAMVGTAALWMAVLCPFTADYTAVVLTETLATFFTTAAVLVFVYFVTELALDLPVDAKGDAAARRRTFLFAAWFLLLGVIVGLGTLVRPETPLVLAAAGIVLCVRWWRRANWPKLILATCWICVGLLLPLAPWATRNARTFGRVEFLGPRYAQSFGDFIPRGYFAWTQTWMTRFGEAYLVTWTLGKQPIDIATVPSAAFDSDAEQARVAELLARYDRDLQMTPVLDREFAVLAAERTARNPLRTYVFVPAARIGAMWLTPRIELLPYSGKLWPAGEHWRGNPADFGVTFGFGVLGLVYLGMAAVGWWRCRAQLAATFLVLFVAIRTVAMTQLQTVEPRYVIECFPVIVALGALVWAMPGRQSDAAHGFEIRHDNSIAG
jgi:4-amino-4-deoxy-L-arabinose transferase-like glycosyltransferase